MNSGSEYSYKRQLPSVLFFSNLFSSFSIIYHVCCQCCIQIQSSSSSAFEQGHEGWRDPQVFQKWTVSVDFAYEIVHWHLFKRYLGWSGFTGVGYPKMVPLALADHVEQNSLQGKLKFNLFVGASSGPECEDRWAQLDMIDRRYPHQVGRSIKKGINEGRIRFADKHLSMFPQDLVYGKLHVYTILTS